MEITKEEFVEYVRVQKSGVTNMMDTWNVIKLTGLTREKIYLIMRDYSKLEKKFKQYVRNKQLNKDKWVPAQTLIDNSW